MKQYVLIVSIFLMLTGCMMKEDKRERDTQKMKTGSSFVEEASNMPVISSTPQASKKTTPNPSPTEKTFKGSTPARGPKGNTEPSSTPAVKSTPKPVPSQVKKKEQAKKPTPTMKNTLITPMVSCDGDFCKIVYSTPKADK